MRPMTIPAALAVVAAGLGLLGQVAATSADAPTGTNSPIDFARDVRPILADNCFTCHGADDQSRKSKLRLDGRDHAIKGGSSGLAAIVPGNPDDSELIARVNSEDPDEVMPPPSTKRKLTPQQIATLRGWIEKGADYQAHWAFQPPQRPALPTVSDSSWIKTPVDAFILARLDKEGIQHAPSADRPTLLRRLSLDLIGLPPTPEEIDQFASDSSPDAIDKVVDRLLKSSHHGERWARHWLDAARYADSDGFEKDKPRSVWMYRDWVVNAINRDLPYDQFIIEQLAGDLLPNATQDQRVATGFLRNSMINEEGGVDPEQFRMSAMFDRMDALGKSVLGVTVNCCQCHTHKYDPITQEEYYRMFAYFNDTHEASIPAYSPTEQMRRSEIFRGIHELEEDLKHKNPDWPDKLAEWEKARANQGGVGRTSWTVVNVKNEGDNAQRYVEHPDGSLTAWGYAPTKWESQFRGRTELKRVTAVRLELLTDPNLPLGGPGRSPTGLFGLSEFQVDVADAAKPDKTTRVDLISASADFEHEPRPLDRMYDDKSGKTRLIGPIVYSIDGKDDTAWGIDAGPGRRNVGRNAVFVPRTPIEFPQGAILTFHLVQKHGGWNSDDNQNNNLGRFRFSVTSDPTPAADLVPATVRDLLAIPAAQRTPGQTAAVFSHWRTTVTAWSESNARIEALWRQHPEGGSQLTFQARERARPTFMLARGDFLKPVQQVQPGVPAALDPLPRDTPPDRLSFARWLVGKDSPTTARSIVNRVWQSYFGTGIVATSEDLGTQCAPPSHPELLDWLAVEFMDHGWSLKHLHRLIVLSSTYQQSSQVTPELLKKDPINRLLAHAPRLRVEGEVVRDIALAVSGLLNPEVGGPPAFPPAPDFLFQPPASYGPKTWIEDKGPGRYRRGLYTFRFRSVPYPVLTNFDTPNGDASCVRRVRSNTPVQALTTLNEPLFLECARGLARVVLAAPGRSQHDRLVDAFRRCVGRPPSTVEEQVLGQFLSKQLERFQGKDSKPWELAADDPAHPPTPPANVTPAELAGWTALARVLLNLDETITKE